MPQKVGPHSTSTLKAWLPTSGASVHHVQATLLDFILRPNLMVWQHFHCHAKRSLDGSMVIFMSQPRNSGWASFQSHLNLEVHEVSEMSPFDSTLDKHQHHYFPPFHARNPKTCFACTLYRWVRAISNSAQGAPAQGAPVTQLTNTQLEMLSTVKITYKVSLDKSKSRLEAVLLPPGYAQALKPIMWKVASVKFCFIIYFKFIYYLTSTHIAPNLRFRMALLVS